ncbi:MAG: hypothetical protein AABZ15_07545 [Nitrospirota bacterium]
MGITIYAWGRIDRIGDIARLIEDVKRLAGESKWACRIIDDDFAEQPNAVLFGQGPDGSAAAIEGSLGLKGIIVNLDKGTEPLAILFDRSGTLTGIIEQLSWVHSKEQSERFTACKTQFGSMDSHVGIIELFASLKEKYITDLIVNDEGDYWETRDRRILAEKRIALGHCLRHTERVIGTIESSGGEVLDPETLAARIEQALLKEDQRE